MAGRLASYQAAAATAIRRHHGYVAQHLGDGLVAYFGYPVAGEDDAVRAVQAALEVVRDVGKLPLPARGGALRVRVGLHTGPAVMGRVGGREGEYGARRHRQHRRADPVGRAARRRGAQPRHALAGGRAHALRRSRGAHAQGLAAPLRLYQAHAMGPADDERSGDGLSPFPGRGREFDLLQARWREAGAAAGRCVLSGRRPGDRQVAAGARAARPRRAAGRRRVDDAVLRARRPHAFRAAGAVPAPGHGHHRRGRNGCRRPRPRARRGGRPRTRRWPARCAACWAWTHPTMRRPT
ncbi:adenylate/guanylate cyclase domain-containing protein [Ramlibacter terrae]|uniref:Adenylate/guanylate cyclase domain-containing protein n=1 Tax=Ramlibacter terrae TaxID=2732511 RepID=A0ABX6P4X8_9BURK|nr:adenylate/guanylate cyclase domain-containing protein [Ramlibacter terrae]